MMQTLETPISFSIKGACAATGLSRTKIYALIADGRLRAVKIDGRTLIPADSLRALIAEVS